jgi:hypothetical protein
VRAARVAACIALLALAGACRSVPGAGLVTRVFSGAPPSGRISQQELRELLVQYAAQFEATVVAAADTIREGTTDPEVRRAALLWELRTIPIVNEAAFQGEPEAAYVSMLVLATSMHEYVAGEGGKRLGDQQAMAVAASDELVVGAKQIGETFLSKKQLARVSKQVDELVARHPMRGEFVAEGIQSLAAAPHTSNAFNWVTSIPLSPFRALQGVDEGAQAIREFNETAMRFNRLAASMPRLVRWNLELLAYELGRQPAFGSGLESFESLARSADELSRTAQSLPADVRELLAEAERSGKSLEPLAQSLERTATAVGAAGTAWSGLVEDMRDRPSDGPPSRPFDIREWDQTALRVSTAAVEMRSLVDSLQTLSSSEAIPPALAELTGRLERVEASSRSLVDLAALRGLQLIAVFFVLLFLHRRVEAWLARRAGTR